MKDAFYLVIGLVIVGGSIFLFLGSPVNKEPAIMSVEIDGNLIEVDIADSLMEQARGLSGRTELKNGSGMLFIYETPDDYGFWMKDMNFSIDMIWIDEDGKVITIHPSISPETYPTVFSPTGPAKYVLEVPAGFSESKGIDIGDSVSFRE